MDQILTISGVADASISATVFTPLVAVTDSRHTNWSDSCKHTLQISATDSIFIEGYNKLSSLVSNGESTFTNSDPEFCVFMLIFTRSSFFLAFFVVDLVITDFSAFLYFFFGTKYNNLVNNN